MGVLSVAMAHRRAARTLVRHVGSVFGQIVTALQHEVAGLT